MSGMPPLTLSSCFSGRAFTEHIDGASDDNLAEAHRFVAAFEAMLALGLAEILAWSAVPISHPVFFPWEISNLASPFRVPFVANRPPSTSLRGKPRYFLRRRPPSRAEFLIPLRLMPLTFVQIRRHQNRLEGSIHFLMMRQFPSGKKYVVVPRGANPSRFRVLGREMGKIEGPTKPLGWSINFSRNMLVYSVGGINPLNRLKNLPSGFFPKAWPGMSPVGTCILGRDCLLCFPKDTTMMKNEA